MRLPKIRASGWTPFCTRNCRSTAGRRIQTWIRGGDVRVAGKAEKSSYLIRGTEEIEVEPVPLPPLRATAEDIPLTVLYEDESAVVIDKAAGMVVHAGAGNMTARGERAAAPLRAVYPSVGGDLRPGIVHRLDRFTSGVLLVAKTDAAHRDLALQFSSRQVEKIYLTLVEGKHDGQRANKKTDRRGTRGTGRDDGAAGNRARGADGLGGAGTLRRHITFLRVRLGTGRTHQIRAHWPRWGIRWREIRLYGAKPPRGTGTSCMRTAGVSKPGDRRAVVVESPLPPELERVEARIIGTNRRSHMKLQLRPRAVALVLRVAISLLCFALRAAGPEEARGGQKSLSTEQIPAQTKEDRADHRITLDVTRVNILFTVTDKKGRFVTDLGKDDFQVDGKQEAADRFRSSRRKAICRCGWRFWSIPATASGRSSSSSRRRRSGSCRA